jgi:hypothetical protein
MMTRVIFCILGVILTACGHTASQSIPVQISGNKNQIAQPTTAPSPEIVSKCAEKWIYGLSKGINIPQQLCVDYKKPIDKSERINVPSGNNAVYARYEAVDVPFEKLAEGVRNIVRLTAPDVNPNELLFSIQMLPTKDTTTDKLIKSYIYNSYAKDKQNKDTKNNKSWTFKRQDNALKLDGAQFEEIKEAKNTETKDFITINCTKNKISAIPAKAKLPVITPDLCFDDKRTADASEYSKVLPKDSRNSIIKDEENISFDELPAEVQNIICVTSGDRNVNKKFYLSVMLDYGDDPNARVKKVVKDYLYYLNRQSGRDESWTFKRQDNRLKLTQAEILKQ